MRRWSQHLIKNKQKHLAIQILLTLGEFHTVMQLLSEIQCPDIAVLFYAACIEQNLIAPADDGIDIVGFEASSAQEIGSVPTPLLETIHTDFGSILHKLGWTQGAIYYWQKGGKSGSNMLEKI